MNETAAMVETAIRAGVAHALSFGHLGEAVQEFKPDATDRLVAAVIQQLNVRGFKITRSMLPRDSS